MKYTVIFILIIAFAMCSLCYNSYSYRRSKVYISLTTIPERLIDPWFYKNLKHIMNLKGKYTVVLNIPYTFKRTGEDYIIPDNILKLEKKNLIIHRIDEDYGPLTKLYGALLCKDIPDNAALLICDDDIVYKSKFVTTIYNQYKKDNTKIYTYCNKKIEGYLGYMVNKRRISPILDIKRPSSCFRIDDDFIENSVDMLNIEKEIVLYDNNNDWTCAFDKSKTDTHPPWYVLVKDNREPMVEECKRDMKELNK